MGVYENGIVRMLGPMSPADLDALKADFGGDAGIVGKLQEQMGAAGGVEGNRGVVEALLGGIPNDELKELSRAIGAEFAQKYGPNAGAREVTEGWAEPPSDLLKAFMTGDTGMQRMMDGEQKFEASVQSVPPATAQDSQVGQNMGLDQMIEQGTFEGEVRPSPPPQGQGRPRPRDDPPDTPPGPGGHVSGMGAFADDGGGVADAISGRVMVDAKPGDGLSTQRVDYDWDNPDAAPQLNAALADAKEYAKTLGYDDVVLRPTGHFVRGMSPSEWMRVQLVDGNGNLHGAGQILAEAPGGHLQEIKSSAELAQEMRAMIKDYYDSKH